MGEHTIREILRRRSPETQRAMKRRRELAGVSGDRNPTPWFVLLALVLALLAGVVYLGFQVHAASQRFAADKASRTGGMTLNGTTEFLPNTLLAAYDPAFYNSGALSGTLLTRRVVRILYPDSSGVVVHAMAVALEAGYGKTDILETFINDAPMGGDAAHPVKGFAAASMYYFGKPFAQLHPQDIALLVAIADDPRLDPRRDPAKAVDARNLVLQADVQQNVLSEAQVAGLSKLPLDVSPQPAG
ncbi:MAG TPA: transglycosylase domain-containing protein [Gammaproteobacteria bacterium]|nr:transglycosylase domain-containing protein [Gammaproteobacteria bacterium]